MYCNGRSQLLWLFPPKSVFLRRPVWYGTERDGMVNEEDEDEDDGDERERSKE